MSFVSIVGTGPGHIDYITLKGYNRIKEADVILYDALIDVSIKAEFPKTAEAIYVGKRAGAHLFSQENIQTLLLKKARQGLRVVRLKGGDPFVYGRGGEEVLALQKSNISFEIVPGVSAVNAVTALAGIPTTHRGVSDKVLILEGHDLSKSNHDWNSYANFDGTLVIYMGTKTLQTVSKRLLKHGANRDKPVALIENGSFENQVVQKSTLGKIAKKGLSKKTTGPGLIVIGEVVSFNFHSINLPNQFREVAS